LQFGKASDRDAITGGAAIGGRTATLAEKAAGYAGSSRRWLGDQFERPPEPIASFVTRASLLKSTAPNLSLTSRHPVKKGEIPSVRGGTLGAARLVVFPNLEHAGKMGVHKTPKKGGWIMKAKSFLLTVVAVTTGLTFLSLPAGAECWMTCPPGSTTTPSAARNQGVTATAEPTASPKLTTAKKAEGTESSPTPAKPKAAPIPVGATAPATTAQKTETTAKASPTPVPAKPKATPLADGTGPATEPPPIPPAAPALMPAPSQGEATPPVPVPQSSETNAAFQLPPAQAAPPAPAPIPGPVPGTATMRVIPE
jgi:hypothetical protein